MIYKIFPALFFNDCFYFYKQFIFSDTSEKKTEVAKAIKHLKVMKKLFTTVSFKSICVT
jgi:hypothetical protein